MNPKEPIESAISELQEGRSSRPSWRQRFFDTLKHKYSNLYALYVTTNVIAIWSGAIFISDSWAHKVNLMAEPTPEFSLEVALRYLSLLSLSLTWLLISRWASRRPMTRFMADKILKKACERIGVVGVSTHSFRRTALTQMCSAGIPLRHIQEISGHNDLGTLQRYLEVSPDQRKKAVSVIGW